MKKFLIFLTIFIMTLIGIVYGFLIQRYKIFPFRHIETASHFVRHIIPYKTYGPWSIGVYKGSSPFDLVAPSDVANPVLTGKDVVDVDAMFVADPFLVFAQNKYTMFFEVLNRETKQGDIGYAESTDGKTWKYRKIVIHEPFHLSYPYVFEWKGDYYIIPESGQDLSVRLYKAVSFPEKWVYVGNLLSGYNFKDPSIFQYNKKWWLFVAANESDVLNLYYANDLRGEWKPHPMNPIVKFNNKIARPGGRVIVYNGRLYRFTQDDSSSYGNRVFAFEITELSEKLYKEKLIEKPIVNMIGKGWNSAGMHNVDLHKIENRWTASVDGRNR
jgi:hypothetical protein